jgi:hypothetical protein
MNFEYWLVTVVIKICYKIPSTRYQLAKEEATWIAMDMLKVVGSVAVVVMAAYFGVKGWGQ